MTITVNEFTSLISLVLTVMGDIFTTLDDVDLVVGLSLLDLLISIAFINHLFVLLEELIYGNVEEEPEQWYDPRGGDSL